MSAVPSALSSATQGAANSALVNQPLDESPGIAWPGAIGADEHVAGTWLDHSVIDDVAPPRPSPQTPPDANTLLGAPVTDAEASPGVEPSSTGWLSHDGPTEPWDASAGQPFAGSGPIPGDVHGIAVPELQGETPADIGNVVNQSRDSQSYAPAWSWDSTTGQRENTPTPRVAHDTSFDVNGSGLNYQPRFYTPEVNPIYNNLAITGQPTNRVAEPYSPLGSLPDNAQYADNQSIVYEPPPDPVVTEANAGYTSHGGIEGVL